MSPQDHLNPLCEEAKLILKDVVDLLHGAVLDDLEGVELAARGMQHAAERGNALLAEAKIAELKKKIPELTEKSRKTAENLSGDRKKKIEEGLERLREAADREIEAARNVLKNPTDVAARKKLKAAAGDVEKAIRDLSDAFLNRDPDLDLDAVRYEDQDLDDDSDDDFPTAVIAPEEDQPLESIPPPPDDESPLARDIARVKATGGAVRKGALKKNPDMVALNAKKGEKEIFELAEKLRSLVEDVQDPAKKKTAANAGQHVEDTFPNLLDKAKEVLLNPEDSVAKHQLEDAEGMFNNALQAMERATRQPDLKENILRFKKMLDNLEGAKKSHDSNVDDIMKNVCDLEAKISQQALQQLQNNNGPNKEIIKQAQIQLHNTIQPLKHACTQDNVSDAQLSQAVSNSKEAADHLGQVTHSPTLSAINDLHLLVDDLRDLSEPLDLPSIQLAALDFFPASEDLLRTILSSTSENLRDPIQLKNIQAAVKELPFAIKNVLNPIKSVLLNPMDDFAKKNIGTSLGEVEDILVILQSAVQNKDAVTMEKKLLDIKADAILRVIPKIDSGTEKLTENPRDPRTKKQLIRLADRAGDKTEELNKILIGTNTSDRADQKKREIKHNVADLVRAVEQADDKKFQCSLKTIQRTLPEYKELLKSAAEQTEDPKKKEEISEAIKSAEMILPEVVDVSKTVFKDPTSLDKKNDFRDTTQRFNRAVNRAGNKMTSTQDEKNIRDAGEELRKKIAAIRAANRAKREKDVAENTSSDIKPVITLVRAVDRRGKQLPPKLEAELATKELQDIWKKFGVGARKGVPEKELDEIQKKLESKVKQVSEVTASDSIAAVQDVEEALDNILDITENNKPHLLRTAATDLTNKTRALGEKGKDLPTPAQREKFSYVFGKLNVPLKDVLQRANEAIKEPDNKEKKKKLQEAIDSIEVPLCEVKIIIDPQSRDRQVEIDIAKTKAALGDLTEKSRSGTPIEVSAALLTAKTQADTTLNVIKNIIANEIPGSQRRKIITAAAERLETVVRDLPRVSPNNHAAVEHAKHVTTDALNDLLEVVKSDARDDILESTAKASNRVTTLTRDGHKMRARDVTAESSALSRDLEGMVGSVRDHGGTGVPLPLPEIVHDPTPTRKIMEDIRDIKVARPPPRAGRVTQLVSALETIANPPPPPKPAAPLIPVPPPRPEPITFEDVVDKVAQEIAMKAEELNLKEGSHLSSLLSDLASAARAGNRQELLQQGKKVAASIKEFCEQLRDYASKIPKKNRHELVIQDRLIRAAQALENFGTQLRILTSVKAASVETDKDTDQSLNSIVKGVGVAVTEGLTVIDISNKTIKTK